MGPTSCLFDEGYSEGYSKFHPITIRRVTMRGRLGGDPKKNPLFHPLLFLTVDVFTLHCIFWHMFQGCRVSGSRVHLSRQLIQKEKKDGLPLSCIDFFVYLLNSFNRSCPVCNNDRDSWHPPTFRPNQISIKVNVPFY